MRKPEKSQYPPNSGLTAGSALKKDDFWPPRIVWGREMGWLNVRDLWGDWHSVPAKEAPSGWVRIAQQAKRGGW